MMKRPSLASRFHLVATAGWREHGPRLPFVIGRRAAQYGWRRCFGEKHFRFRGRQLAYMISPLILDNERAVEVAIGLDFAAGCRGTMLEVGNVLNNYREFAHTVVDKYERAPGVLNEDITTYSPATSFDRIVTLSTLEHVGWDETPREPEKIVAAIAKLKSLLALGGELLATMPLGHNARLDQLIREQKTGFDTVTFLKRVSGDNRWVEASLEEVRDAKYGSPYGCANAIFVGTCRRGC